MSSDLERALLDDVQRLLDRWAVRYGDRPDLERLHLLRLALEREQIVAVAYREEAVAGRLADLPVDTDTRALIRQTLVWIWKDEQLHAEYLRGELLRRKGAWSHAVVYGRSLQGVLSDWTSATVNHRDPRQARFRTGAAGALVTVAGLTGQAPPALRRELRFHSFRRYCLLNVALEASAALAYRRLVDLADSDEHREAYDRLRDDEERHVAAFAVLTDAITDRGRLAEGTGTDGLADQLTGTWLDADLRIVVPKLRTDPTEFAHVGLSTLEGSTGSVEATFYSGRQVNFRSATMMLLDVAPPDFCLIDAWAPVADGPFGVMGCSRPADVRHLYGGRDVLTVDEAVLADMGVEDPRQAPILRRAYHWFGLDPAHPPVDGDRPPLRLELRGAHRSLLLRGLGMAAYPVDVYLSDGGDRFVPAMDVRAFPPRGRPSTSTRLLRKAAQQPLGCTHPTGSAPGPGPSCWRPSPQSSTPGS